jgi:hypothetical protein
LRDTGTWKPPEGGSLIYVEKTRNTDKGSVECRRCT